MKYLPLVVGFVVGWIIAELLKTARRNRRRG